VCAVNSDLVNLNGIVHDENLLDIILNINELLELYNMATCPQVWKIMSISIAKLEKETETLNCELKYKETSIPKQKPY
jgi:hypothetical protein